MNDAEIFVSCVDEPEGVKDYVTLISPDTFFSRGLCVGSFQVTNGKVVPGSYTRNLNHVILSADGFFSLGPNLNRKLRDEILACYAQ